jgi:FOG: Ankyrin repeat
LRPSQNSFHIVGVYGINDKVKALLVRAQNVDPAQKDKEGRTPLSWVVEYGHTKGVKILLSDDRVDSDLQNNCREASLSPAARKGSTEVIRTLLYLIGKLIHNR